MICYHRTITDNPHQSTLVARSSGRQPCVPSLLRLAPVRPGLDKLAVLVGAATNDHQAGGLTAERAQLFQPVARGLQRMAQDARRLRHIVGSVPGLEQKVVEDLFDLHVREREADQLLLSLRL